MFVKIKESVEEKLRKLCAGLSPEKRVSAIVVLAALFAIGNFYMIFRAIHDIGREDVRPEIIEIPPMEIPDIIPADTLPDKRVQEMEEFFNRFYQKESKYSINSLVYWVTYVHNVVYSFYRSMIYCYINSTQRCAGSIVIDIIPTNGADKRKFFPFAPYFPVTNVIKRYFYPYFPAIIGIKGYSFPYFPYLSGIMKIKTALYSLFSRLDWHKTVVFPCLGEIYEGIRSLSWEIPVT